MHVAINANLLHIGTGYRSAGIARYLAGMLRGLQETAGAMRFTVFTGRQPQPSALPSRGGFRVVESALASGGPLRRIAWEQTVQPWRLLAARPDLLHSGAYASPLLWNGPTVLTIYDLSFLLFPDRFNTGNRTYLSHITRLSARRARRIVAISQSTRADIVSHLGVPEQRIDVVPPALDPGMRPRDPAAVAEFRSRRGLPARFVLYLGTLEPRKNVPTLVEAFGRLRSSLPDCRLVLAGGRGWGYDGIERAIAAGAFQEGEVVFPGYVPQEEVPFWYAAAAVFAYPSAYEGFGLPVLEALACGATVVTTNSSSLPEAAGGSALLVPAGDADALAQALRSAIEDEGLRGALRKRGLAHAAAFTTTAMGTRMIDVYTRALAGNAQAPRRQTAPVPPSFSERDQ